MKYMREYPSIVFNKRTNVRRKGRAKKWRTQLEEVAPVTKYATELTLSGSEWYLGNLHLKGVHDASRCDGRPCVVHHPSQHSMRSLPLTWRDDKGVFERICPHGIGHTDPDNATWLISIGRGAWAEHGCDFCCAPGIEAFNHAVS